MTKSNNFCLFRIFYRAQGTQRAGGIILSRTEHAEGAERNHFLLPTSRFLLHTRLPAEVTIGAVWTNRVLPDDAGQVSTGQIDAG